MHGVGYRGPGPLRAHRGPTRARRRIVRARRRRRVCVPSAEAFVVEVSLRPRRIRAFRRHHSLARILSHQRRDRDSTRESGWEIVRVLDEPIDFPRARQRQRRQDAAADRRSVAGAGQPAVQPDRHLYRSAAQRRRWRWSRRIPRLSVRAYAGDYFDVLASRALQFERRMLAMFMGSNIGNYEPPKRAHVLTLLAAMLCGRATGYCWEPI